MNVVLDTNVFLVILPENSIYHPVYDALYQGKYNLILSHQIVLEYEEQFSLRYGTPITTKIIEGLVNSNNFIFCDPRFSFNLIYHDPDDNKFVDCAVAGNGDYIVTNDRHFDVLKSVDFPSINCITLQEFQKILYPDFL
jgi:uncharacterized protein